MTQKWEYKYPREPLRYYPTTGLMITKMQELVELSVFCGGEFLSHSSDPEDLSQTWLMCRNRQRAQAVSPIINMSHLLADAGFLRQS